MKRRVAIVGVVAMTAAMTATVGIATASDTSARAAASSPAGHGILKNVSLHPEGRVLRVSLKAAAPIDRFTLSRQGPPEKRDLVIRLPGFTTETPARVEAGDWMLPIDITVDDTAASPGVQVVLGNVGDSLVSVAQDGGDLSIVIIPPEKKTDLAGAYHIGINDSLQIDVFGHEDLNKTLKVSPRGLINFPLIGNVHAEGRTVDDVSAEITDRLAKDFIQDPHVTVSVWEYLSQWVNVIGEVAHPGRYYMTGATYLIDAISQAGGLTGAAGSQILVTRRPVEGDPASAGDVFRVEIKALFSTEGSGLNMKLLPGDIVNILGAETPRAVRP